MIDMYRDLAYARQAERKVFGQPCPMCGIERPKAQATILLPGRTCRAHKPHYRDQRPEPSVEDWNAAMAETGVQRVGEGSGR
jgi:hypothetical protein